MITPVIVTVDQLRQHLRLPTITEGSPPVAIDEDDLQLKLDAATQLVCDELVADQGSPPDAIWVDAIEGWTIGSPEAPALVRLAVLEQAAAMYRFRGDDEPSQDKADPLDSVIPSVRSLLRRYRRAVFA